MLCLRRKIGGLSIVEYGLEWRLFAAMSGYCAQESHYEENLARFGTSHALDLNKAGEQSVTPSFIRTSAGKADTTRGLLKPRDRWRLRCTVAMIDQSVLEYLISCIWTRLTPGIYAALGASVKMRITAEARADSALRVAHMAQEP